MVDPVPVPFHQLGVGNMTYHNQSGDHMPACTQSHQNANTKRYGKDHAMKTAFFIISNKLTPL
jgi:hypothetical protein